PDHLDVIGDEADRADHHVGHTLLGVERAYVVHDVWLEPRHVRRPGAGLPHEIVVGDAGLPGDQTGRLGDLAAVEAAGAVGRTGVEVGALGDGVGGEDDAGPGRRAAYGLPEVSGEAPDEQGVVVELPQAVQCGRVRHRGSGPRDVLLVLGTPRVAAPRGGGDHRRTAHAVGRHLPDRVLGHGRPVAVTEVDGQVPPPQDELVAEVVDDLQIEVVELASASEAAVVGGPLLEPLRVDAPAAGDILEDRDDVLLAVGPAEGEQQQGVHGGGLRHVSPP